MVEYIKRVRRVPETRNRQTRRFWGRRWHDASTAFLRQYPFCVLCLCRGKINDEATVDAITTQRSLVVDHLIPHHGNRDRFWDQYNWETLCRLCHDRDKQSVERQGSDWLAYLRSEIERCNAQAHVERYAEWLPACVKDGVVGEHVGVGIANARGGI